jgi:uncharacterized repeat protein (TIGR01451 family)
MANLNIFKEETLQKIADNLNETNVYLKSIASGKKFDITTMESIVNVVQAGIAQKYLSVGDQIIVPYTYNGTVYDFVWDIVDFQDIEDEHGEIKNAMQLQAHYLTPESVQFDREEQEVATETTFQEGLTYYTKNDDGGITIQNVTVGDTIPTDTTYYHNAIRDTTTNMYRYGYNRWSHSAFRQWLNSAEDKGNWWKAQHIGDVAPSQLNQYKGFLAGFEDDFLQYIKPFKVVTACNTVTDGGVYDVTYDRFILPSLEQIYVNPQAADEGETFEYWKEAFPNNSAPNAQYSTNSEYIKYGIENKNNAQTWRLRSAYRGSSSYSWYVYTGGVSYGGAFNSYRAAPVCSIF